MDGDVQPQSVSPPASDASERLKKSDDATPSTMSFLGLPAEIRNMVYHYPFPEGRSAVQLLKRNTGTGYIAMSDRLGLMATCRQIYKEASSVLKHRRRFLVVKPKTLKRLLQDLFWEELDDEEELSRNHILQHIIPSEGIKFKYDLDNQSLDRNAPGLMYTDQWLRDMCIMDYAGGCISAEMKATTVKSDFQGFQTLQKWIKDGHADPISDGEPPYFKTRIILEFHISDRARPEDARFDGTALLRATRRLHKPKTALQVDVKDGGRWESSSGTVDDIHARVLLFMWKLIEDLPKRRTGPCPAIWVDDLLWPREAGFIDEDGKIHIVSNKWTSRHGPVDIPDDVEYVVDVLLYMWGQGDSEPEDGPEETDFDKDSLLGVATELALRMAHGF